MKPRFLAIGTLFTVAALGMALPSTAWAAPKDGQANAAIKQALEEDYLATDFDAGVMRIEGAIKACGKSGCSKEVLAKAYVSLGTVLAGGKKQLDDAQDAFVKALELDPGAELDPDYTKSEIRFAFEEARKLAGSAAPPPVNVSLPDHDSGILVSPPDEQEVGTPVPLYVQLSGDVAASTIKLVASFKAPGGASGDVVFLKVDDTSYRALLPCKAVKRSGTVRYWITAYDADDETVAARGAADAPLSTKLVSDLSGEKPAWPGMDPPAACGGTEPVAGPVDDPDNRQCVDDADCPSSDMCDAGRCTLRDVADDDGDSTTEKRRNWISLSFVPDITMISGDDVCSVAGQEDGSYVCVREDGSRYVGTPTAGQGNNVNFGFGLGTLRLMLAYDRLVLDNLMLGLRLGFAFRGASEGDASFLPFHGEGRVSYYLGDDPFASTGVRPFVFASGGVAQVDTPIDVEVVEDGSACGAADPSNFDSACTIASPDGVTESRVQTLTAYKQAGQGFAGVGFGLSYAPSDVVSLNLGVRGSVTFPVATFVVSPEAGVGFGF